MTDTAPPARGKRDTNFVAPAAGVAAAGALVCAACCVLPFALPAAVLAVAGGALAWLASVNEQAIVRRLRSLQPAGDGSLGNLGAQESVPLLRPCW